MDERHKPYYQVLLELLGILDQDKRHSFACTLDERHSSSLKSR